MVRLQPTPTDRIDNKNLSTLDKMIFCYLWWMTRWEKWRIQFFNGNKKVDFEIERGQVFVQISKIADDLNINRKVVTKSIENIKKWYINLDITRKSSWLLLTWVSYDELIKMDIKKDITGTSQGHHRDKHKQDSIKIDKIDKNKASKKSSSVTTEEKKEMFAEFWKLYPNKQWKAKSEEWYIKNITEELHKDILKWVQAYKRTTEEKKSRKEFAPEYKHWSSFLNARVWEDFTTISEEEAFREAYEKWDAKIYSWRCKTEIWDTRSTTEDYYKPYNDLKSAILQKNNERDWYDNFISCYETKWKK